MSFNYLPPTRRTSIKEGSKPCSDPLNLVKVSNNPLATQAQETIQKLEQKNLKDETLKTQRNDAWMSQLDSWKSKRKCIQSRVNMDSSICDALETPTDFSITLIENQMKHKTDVADDSKEFMQRKSSNHKKYLQMTDVSQDVIFNHEQKTMNDPTKNEQNFDISANLKTFNTFVPSPTLYSQIHKSAMSTSFTTSNLSSTPTETLKRSNTSPFYIERPKSSIVSNAPKVPLKNFKLLKNAIIESEPFTAGRIKTEEKTAQASIKRFNNLKNFFEQASTTDNIEKVDSDNKSYKPLVRVKSGSCTLDPKKRMSLGPGVLERSTIRNSIAIANDKEYIIDELFVESPQNISTRPANRGDPQNEFSTPISPTKKSPTKVLSFSDDTSNSNKSDISLEDFKGMISIPTSLSQPRQTQLSEVLKKEDEVFATPRICQNEFNIKKITLTKEYNYKEQDNPGLKYFSDEINLYKLENEDKVVNLPENMKQIETILKLNNIKDNKNYSMNLPRNEDKFVLPVSMDGFSITLPVETDSKMDKSFDYVDPSGNLLSQEESSQCPDLIVVGSIKVSESIAVQNAKLTNKKFNLKEIKEDSQSSLIQRNKETDLDINSLSDKFDKFLEELNFFPSPNDVNDITAKPVIEPIITLKSKEIENESSALEKYPQNSTKLLDSIDGNSSSTTLNNVGLCLEKKSSQERVMPDVLVFKTMKTSQEGNKHIAKDIQNAKSNAIPKVPPKPSRAQSCKAAALFPGFSASLNDKLKKKEQKIECDVGIDLDTRGNLNLLDISACRARVELARKSKRRPPSLFGRSSSADDLLDSVPLKRVDVERKGDKNGFLLNENLKIKEINQREDNSSDDGNPPALPSCPPPQHNLTVISLDKFTPVTLNLSDSNSDDEMLPESSA